MGIERGGRMGEAEARSQKKEAKEGRVKEGDEEGRIKRE